MRLLPLEAPEGCNCCTDAALLSWHLVCQEIEPEIAREARKGDDLTDGGEDGTDDFLKDELEIALLLLLAWRKAADKARPILEKALTGTFSLGNWTHAKAEATADFSGLFTHSEKKFRSHVNSTLKAGALKVMSSDVTPQPSTSTFADGLVKAAQAATDGHFEVQVLPRIERAVNAAIEATGAGVDVPDFTAVIELLHDVLGEADPYWGILGNVAASRGYHYGMLKAMQDAGTLAYRLVAVIDERTSAVCRELNGMTFLVTDAVNLLDRLAADPDPDAARHYTPWVSAAKVRGKSAADLIAMGVIVPPFHPLCRTTIQQVA